MKKFLAVMMLVAFAVTMFPAITTYASAQTVECSWWGKMVNGDYYKGRKGQRRLQQERDYYKREYYRRQQQQR